MPYIYFCHNDHKGGAAIMTLEQGRIYVTVDVLPLSVYEGTLYILLSRRKDPPYQERWALPGRFVDAEESAEAAAGRLIH